jgi:enoyl-CoA hydratase/carnithine racemase
MTDVLVTDDGPIRTVRMQRPEKKNALTLAMYDTMAAALERANTEAAIRCVIIAGLPGAFCAGNDLADFLAAASHGTTIGPPILRFLYALARSEKPLVAAVGGVAVGVGTTMLLHCDHVVAAAEAKLSTPFVSLGVVPEAASSLIAPRLMGHARAFSLLVMGQSLSAHEAQNAGLVNTVVPAADVEAQALAAARHIAALPHEAVLASRRLLRGSPKEIIARIDEEAAEFKRRLASPESQAALRAFLSRKN